ncbi:hypothetical protein HRbin32_01781 [bacterium HR32]|nr:hypothetical protein HRbin32_01781 [bacterium HR32]
MDAKVVERARQEGFPPPPPRVGCPVVDLHTHLAGPQPPRWARRLPGVRRLAHWAGWREDPDRQLLAAAWAYGVRHVVGIGGLQAGRHGRGAEPCVHLAVPVSWEAWGDPKGFAEENLRLLDEAARAGVRIVKLWMAPRLRDRLPPPPPTVDAQALDPVFAFVERWEMALLVHVADPDRWFATRYADSARYGRKEDHHRALERRLARHRNVLFQAAHMGGDPEHLDHLDRLLRDHPNLVLDTAGTRWMVRELGRDPTRSRAFFERWHDRIGFGTDQVVVREPEPHRYALRYWVHRIFWETDLRLPLPLEDPDAGQPVLQGIALPPWVLESLYWKTPRRLLASAGLLGGGT